MQTSSRRRSAGFTLVELLVVIAIIVVLAAAGFGAGSFAMTKARSTASGTYASAVVTAVEGYYSTYGALPSVGDNLRTDRGDGLKLLEVLLGVEPQGGKIQNTRNVKFLEVKETTKNAGGLRYKSGSGRKVDGLYDDFGNPFYIELDRNYEDRLRFNQGSKRVTLNGRRVAVYSAGPDKKLGTTDDIKTW